MKYIKKYEKVGKRKFWLLPTDDRFEKALNIINCAPSKKDDFLADRSQNMRRYKYIYISYDSDEKSISRQWGWMPYYRHDHDNNDQLIDSKQWFIDDGYKDFDYIGLTNAEIEEIEIKKTQDKYNL